MHEVLKTMSDPVGLFGVIIILIAYFLLSIDRLSSESLSYQFANLFGAFFILFSLHFNWNLSSWIMEWAWAAVSVIGIYRILNKK